MILIQSSLRFLIDNGSSLSLPDSSSTDEQMVSDELAMHHKEMMKAFVSTKMSHVCVVRESYHDNK